MLDELRRIEYQEHSDERSKAAIDEFMQRMHVERVKGYEKYGKVAIEPGGHPDYDVLDYMINEVVGISDRYAEMLWNRSELFPSPEREMAREVATNMRDDVSEIALHLIYIRQGLLLRGETLGKPEYDPLLFRQQLMKRRPCIHCKDGFFHHNVVTLKHRDPKSPCPGYEEGPNAT